MIARPPVVDNNKKQPEPYVYQEFPRMLYSIGGAITVNNQAEKDFYMEKGYAETPMKFNRAEDVKKEIAWHKAEIVKLEKEMKTLEANPVIEYKHPIYEAPETTPEELEPPAPIVDENKVPEPIAPDPAGIHAKVEAHHRQETENKKKGNSALGKMGLE